MYPVYIFLFASVSAIANSQIDVVFPAVETSRSRVKTIKFRALDQDVEVILQPAGKILAKDFGFVDENRQLYHPVNVSNLKSKLYRNGAKGTALLIDEDGPLTIEGIINWKLRIAPHESGRMDKDGRIAHQVVKETSEEKSYFHDAVMPVNVEIEEESMKRMDRNNKCIVIEFLSVTDSNLTKRFRNHEELTKHMTVTYIGVQNLLEQLDKRIQVRLLGIEAFTKETEPSFIEDSAVPGHEKYLNYIKLLDNFEDYYCKRDEDLVKKADIIMLTTKRSLAGVSDSGKLNTNVGGVASASAVCKRCWKYGIANHFETFNIRIEGICHESAHLIGVPHDGGSGESVSLSNGPGALNCPPEDGYLMGNFKNYDRMEFSECSKACAKYLLSLPRANCVFEDCIKDDDI